MKTRIYRAWLTYVAIFAMLFALAAPTNGARADEFNLSSATVAQTLEIDPNALTLQVGGSQPLFSSIWDQPVQWTSSLEDVATVDADGIVTAVAPGTTTITATLASDPTVTAQANITVIEKQEESVTVSLRVEGLDGQTVLEATYVTLEDNTATDNKSYTFDYGMPTAYAALTKALNEAKIDYDGDATATPYVSKIGDLEAGHFGGYDGWQYKVIRDGAEDPRVHLLGMGSYALQDGDELIVYYGGIALPDEDDADHTDEGENEEQDPAIDQAIEKIVSYYRSQGTPTSDWAVFGLNALGEDVNRGPYVSDEISFAKTLVDREYADDASTTIGNVAKTIIAIQSLGYDPTSFADKNWVEQLQRQKNYALIHQAMFGLIALDAAGAIESAETTLTREKLIEKILSSSRFENAWGFGYIDADTTAMALYALAPHRDNPDVKDAIDEAISALQTIQQADGGFGNSSSTIEVVQALTILGIDPQGKAFTLDNGNNPVTNLLTYQLDSGAFSYTKGGAANGMATEKALIAFAALKQFYNDEEVSIYTDIQYAGGTPPSLDETPSGDQPGTGNNGENSGNPSSGGNGGGGAPVQATVTLSVIGEGTIFPQQTVEFRSGDTPYSVLVRALGGQVESSGSGQSAYIKGIAGLREFDHGPESGWMYSVNGQFLSESAGAVTLQRGDRVVWRYTKDGGIDLGERTSAGGSPTSRSSGLTPSVEKALKEVAIQASNETPLHETRGMVVAVLNKDDKMTLEKARQLKEELRNHPIQLSETVQPSESKELTDSKNEIRLTIPEQALTSQTTISVEKQTTNRTEALSSIYTFGPKGLKFEKAVSISIQAPLEIDDLDQLAFVWLNEETNEWIPIPAVVDATTGIVTGIVDHFTPFAVIDRSKLSENDRDISQPLQHVIDHILQKQPISDWEAFALQRAGAAVPASYLSSVKQLIQDNQGQWSKATDLERLALALAAIGEDPTSFAGYDLIERIYNHEQLTRQGNNGVIFALIALDSKPYEIPEGAVWDRTKLIDWLIQNQNEDGGWPLASGSASSVDLTGMAMAALAPYKTKPDVANAIEKAIDWLSSKQMTNGGYDEFGEISSESIAQVMQGLAAVGVDPLDARFVKSEGDLLSALLSFQQPDGGFAHLQGAGTNPMATEQALTALVAYDFYARGKGSIYRLSDTPTDQTPNDDRYVDDAQIASWAKEAVYRARERNIMSGISAEKPTFAPKERLTRAQFVTLLHHALNEEPASSEASIFTDVVNGSWYDRYVSGAYAKGWVKGVSSDHFAPNQAITRQDLAVMLTNALPLSSTPTTDAIKDLNLASEYAKSSIKTVYNKQILVGYDGYFQPNDFVTREMAAVVAMQIVDRLQALP